MGYTDELAKFSRTPVTLIVMTLDYCGREFGVSPCLATGSKCWNTYQTCKYKSAYLKQSKDYKFTSAAAPLPFQAGERPYLKSVSPLATEIKDNLKVNAREKYRLYDEPDTDVGIDPYVTSRPLFPHIPGTYWRKLIARNRNCKGRPIKRYEGLLGLPESEFQSKFIGTIDKITFDRGEAEVEAVDLLKSLADVELPPKVDIKLVSDVAVDTATITLTTLDGLYAAPAYIRIKDDIIYYTGTAGGNQITGCVWGQFDSKKEAHKAKDKVQPVKYYPPTNGFDIMMEMLLTNAGIDAGNVDSTAFDYWRDFPDRDVNFSAVISEPTKLDKLYFELVDLLDCKSWVSEDLKITIRRNIPNEPGRTYTKYLTDEANISHDSTDVDLNEKSRVSRLLIYWDKLATGKIDDVNAYNRLDIAIDPDSEGDNDYAEESEKKIFCRWLRSGYEQEEVMQEYINNLILRQVWRQRDPMPIISLDLELKDREVRTGDYGRISTDEVLNPDGTPIDRAVMQIVKREEKGNKVSIRVLVIGTRKIAFIAPDATADYSASSDADKEYGFITDDEGLMPDGSQGYYIY